MRVLLILLVVSLEGASLWDSSAVPPQLDSRDPSSIEVGVKFTCDVSGLITAIRFYKSLANTGTHVGNLWNVAGQNLGTVIVTGELASGWQQMSFPSSIPVQAGATYIASYFAPVGRYSDTQFFPFPFDVPPLHASAGLFRYTQQSAFPTSVWQGGNFWVDVVFTTGAPPPPPPPPPPSPPPPPPPPPNQTVKMPSVLFLVVE